VYLRYTPAMSERDPAPMTTRQARAVARAATRELGCGLHVVRAEVLSVAVHRYALTACSSSLRGRAGSAARATQTKTISIEQVPAVNSHQASSGW
jgi:hypothetical protein